MGDSPFKYCDYLCENCAEQDRCALYRAMKERKRVRFVNSEDNDYFLSLLEDLKESLTDAFDMIRDKEKEADIDFQGVANRADVNSSIVDNDPLHLLCRDFSTKTFRFLGELYSTLDGEMLRAFDELGWHHPLIPAKAHSAISSLRNGYIGDAISSATVALKSVERCIGALSFLERTLPELSDHSLLLSKTARTIKQSLKQRFFDESFN